MERVLCMGIFLFYLSYQDIRYMKVTGKSIAFFGLASLVCTLAVPRYTLADVLLGAAVGAFFMVMSLLSRGQIGMGDGVIILIAGIIMGGKEILALSFLALTFCFLFSAYLVVRKKVQRDRKLPFVPFLLCAYGSLLIF